MAKKTVRPLSAAVWCVLAASSAPPALAQSAACASTEKPQVTVIVEGVRSARGEVVVELYPNDSERFLAHLGRVERVRRKAESSVTTACINAPSSGMYALVLYHDENNDEVFNRSRIGLPSEGFGFSNNVRPMFRPPSLKSVLFSVPDGASTVRVRMRYLITDRG
jgi:uncharacterized protein (DUF2141 family)